MICTLACAMGLMIDTLLAGVWGDGAVEILGVSIYSTQITLFACAVLQVFLGRLLLKWSGNQTQ